MKKINICILLLLVFIGNAEAKEPFDTQAGMSAYVNVGSLNLYDAMDSFDQYLNMSSKHAVGMINIGNIAGSDDIHVYVDTEGWIVAYITRDENLGKMVQWSGIDYANPALNTTLEDVISRDRIESSGVYAYDLSSNLVNVSVKKLTVSDWYYGIRYLYVDNTINGIKDNIVSSNHYGINISFSRNNTFINNSVSSNLGEGISLSESSDNILTDNYVDSNTGTGISLSVSNHNFLANNKVKLNGKYGISLSNSGYNTIYNNYFDNKNNSHISSSFFSNKWNTTYDCSSGTNIIGGNCIGGNFWAYPNGTGFGQKCTDGDGDGICDSSYQLSASNTDYLPLGKVSGHIPIEYCTDIVSPGVYALTTDIMDSNTNICINIKSKDVVFDGQGHTIDGIETRNTFGIYVRSSIELMNVSIRNIKVTNWDVGIYYSFYSNGDIKNNTALNNSMGFVMSFSNHNTFTNNTASNNDQYGILTTGSNNTFTNNTVSNNGYGISIGGNKNIISKNTASNNHVGIYVGYISGCISGNTIINNNISFNDYGISMISFDCVKDNNIYNNLFNNGKNFIFSQYREGNIWNTSKQSGKNIVGGQYLGGNFWAHPDGTGFSQTCMDAALDGICDSPYEIKGNNIDYLPLAAINTPEGTDVKVEFAGEGTNVTFENVTEGGQTSVTISTTGPSPPAGFQLAGDYYHITTSANHNGNITICINYDDSQVGDETNLDIFHRNGMVWEEVTNYLDNVANIICGVAPSLSPFIVVEPSFKHVDLNIGWNLVSVPVNLPTWELGEEAVVGNPLNVTPTNCLSSIYRYNTNTSLFEKSDHFDNWGWWPATGSESFTELEPGRGYWVMAQQDCSLIFTGTSSSDLNVNLDTGWNLIGWYSLRKAQLGEETVVGNPLNVTPANSLTSIYRYNTNSGLFEKSDHFDNWGWWPATGSESFTQVEPGRGYWVMTQNACEWGHES